MPAALERKLKAQVAGKDWSEKKKDAYVYGTLRKTGWKPSTQKKMSSMDKMIRLAQIDDHLDSIIRFDFGEEDPTKKSWPWGAAKAGALVGTGVAGTLGHQAVMGSGGYGANWAAFKRGGQDLMGQATGNVAAGTGKVGGAIAPYAGKIAGAAQKGLGSVTGKLRKTFSPEMLAKLHLWESKEKAIEFDEHILEPMGNIPKTKIYQEQFPAGPNPGYAPWAKNLSRDEMLKLPFPKLMQYLNKRNILQQVFSKKMERLIELNSKLDEIQFREDRSGKTWKGAAGATGIGLAGYGVYRTHPIKRANIGMNAAIEAGRRHVRQRGLEGNFYKGALKGYGRMGKSGLKAALHARLSSQLDNILEFKSKDMKEKGKEKFEEAKEKFRSKFQKNKGHKSHGGGT